MEIKKSDWTKFIKKFNASNQYRSTTISTTELYHQYVEKIAYAIGENRGFEPGGEIGDWLDAENKIENLNINM